MNVERFESYPTGMYLHVYGGYVRWKDYESIQQQLTATRAELEAVKAEIVPLQKLREFISMAFKESKKWKGESYGLYPIWRMAICIWAKATAAQKQTQSTNVE